MKFGAPLAWTLALGLVGSSLSFAKGAREVLKDPAQLPEEVLSRWAELLQMEDGRLSYRRALPGLRNFDTRIRWLTVRSLGRLGQAGAIPHLLPILNQDPDGAVRQEAALALGLMGLEEDAKPERIAKLAPELERALGDLHAAPSAARSLGWLKAEASIPALLRVAQEARRPASHRVAALKSLIDLSRAPTWPAEGISIQSLEPEVRRLETLLWIRRARTSKQPPEALPGATLSQNPEAIFSVWNARESLAELPTKTLEVAVHAYRGASSPRPGWEGSLARFLGRALSQRELASPETSLGGWIQGRGLHTRTSLLQGLSSLEPAPPRISWLRLGLLEVLEQDDHPEVLARALEALAKVDFEAFRARLSGPAHHPDFRVREAVARALLPRPEGDASGPSRVAARLFEDPDLRVRRAALESIRDRKEEAWTPFLEAALQSRDPPSQLAAAQALSARGFPAIGPEVLHLMKAIPARHHEERRSLLKILVDAKDTRRIEIFEKDEDVLLAEVASQALGKAPKERTRPLAEVEFYRQNLARYPAPMTLGLEVGGEPVSIEVDWTETPLNTWNFLALFQSGFFDGLGFHRVVPGFVAQGGDPTASGMGGPGYMIRCERSGLAYRPGTLGMALAGKDTGGSQWFVTYGPTPHLEGRYTVLGRITQGLDAFQNLSSGARMFSSGATQLAPVRAKAKAKAPPSSASEPKLSPRLENLRRLLEKRQRERSP